MSVNTTPANKESLDALIEETKAAFVYLLSNWMRIALISFTLGVIGTAWVYFKDPNYLAVTTFVSETNSDDKLGGYAGLAAQFGIGLGGMGGGGAFEGDNLMEVFKSRQIVVSTLLQPCNKKNPATLLIHQYLKNHGYSRAWENKQQLSSIQFTTVLTTPNRLRDSILNLIYDNIVKNQLYVDKKDKKLDIITMEVKDIDETFAQLFSEKLTENAIRFYTGYKIKKVKQNVDILQHQADTLRQLLNGNIVSVAATNDLNINPLKQVLRTESQKKQVDLQVSSALYTEILKQLEIANLTLQKETPLIQIIDTPVLPLKKTNMGKLLAGIIFSLSGFCVTIVMLLFSRMLKNKTA